MSEFKARIVAELDTAKLNQQIKELQGKNINLNVKTDTATKLQFSHMYVLQPQHIVRSNYITTICAIV